MWLEPGVLQDRLRFGRRKILEQRPSACRITRLIGNKTDDRSWRADVFRQDTDNRNFVVGKHVAEIEHADIDVARFQTALNRTSAVRNLALRCDLIKNAELRYRLCRTLSRTSKIRVYESYRLCR